MRRFGSTVVMGVALAAIVTGSLSCKVQLTPEGIARTWRKIQDARKDLTPENEYYIGRSLTTTLLAKAEYDYLDKDALRAGRMDGVTKYVNQVGAVLAMAALQTPRKGDRPTPIAGWHFIVTRSAEINAFAAPGGFVIVTSGALKAARNEDELAAVLAHEIAHVMRGHALGTIKKSRWGGVYKEFLDSSVQLDSRALGNLTQVFSGSMNDMIDAMTVKGYSRDTEYEADRVGLAIMVRAGYDPGAFVRYLQTLEQRQHTGRGGFFATHPKASERIARLTKELAKLQRRPANPERQHRFDAAIAAIDRPTDRSTGTEPAPAGPAPIE